MSVIQLELLAIAIMAAAACSLPGVFLVLRGVALMSDAISHAILLGIVVMFLLVHDLSSPWLLFGATIAGLVTVACTEALINTNRIKKDTAIGLVFPLFFSIGIILITWYARDVHLMIVPAATAYLLTSRLRQMIVLTLELSFLAAIGGYGCAYLADVSIAGSIATVAGLIFLGVFVLQIETNRALPR